MRNDPETNNFVEEYDLLKAGTLLGREKLDQLQRDLLTIELVRRFGGNIPNPKR